MKKSRAIWLLLRAPFLTVTFGGIAVGTGFAKWETGIFDPGRFLLAFVGAACLHVAANAVNDYFDFKAGTDASNRSGTSPFSGGSGMILNGHVKPHEALAAALGFTALGAAAGLYLDAVSKGHVVLLIGAAAVLLVFSYNGRPLRLVQHGLGELAIFAAWGPLMVLGAYYVQAQAFGSWWVAGPCVISGVLTTLVLLINEFADRDADRSVGRKTIVVMFGDRGGLVIFLVLALACYAVAALGVAAGGWPWASLAVFLTLPLPFRAYLIGGRSVGQWPVFLGAVRATILMNFLFLIILTLSFVM